MAITASMCRVVLRHILGLKFKPDFKVSMSGKTSKKNGASLSATLSYPATTPGTGQATSQAGIHLVKVVIPKQLPS
jgi:hypothetical protein